jgi:hypothetical protein
MRRQVLPTAPSPTTTSFTECLWAAISSWLVVMGTWVGVLCGKGLAKLSGLRR